MFFFPLSQRFYQIQIKNTFAFRTISEMLERVDPKLIEIGKKSLRQILDEKGYNERILELATVATLTQYGHSTDIDSFAGLCCLSGIGDKLWSIKTGNRAVPVKLLEKSGAKLVLNAKVRTIGKSNVDPKSKNRIVYEINGEEMVDESFDYVIVALPLHSESIRGTDFEIDLSFESESEINKMKVTVVYLIFG